jgi:hypothetical protein
VIPQVPHFRAVGLVAARTTEESSSGGFESEVDVFWEVRMFSGAILLDGSVEGEFGGIEGALEVHVD